MNGWGVALVVYAFVAGGAIGAAVTGIHYRQRAERVQRALAEAGLR